MNTLLFASIFTLTILSSFVFGIVIFALLVIGKMSIVSAIFLTIIINVILWRIGPTITDYINKKLYRVQFISHKELIARYPHIADVVEQVAAKYNFKLPKIGIISDNNPTAFTYGSGRFNARIILTEGIFHFLSDQEARAVVAHELGHVVHRDFIVMMIASTSIQILYEIYAKLIRAKGNHSAIVKVVALMAYLLYIAGLYLLYYLSRTRERLADEFAATMADPNDLSRALIKIAYGIVTAQDGEKSNRLLNSTRHLGITDINNARQCGTTSYVTNDDPQKIAEVMAFDSVSPWAKIAEINSTHPLTGNRIYYLNEIAKSEGIPVVFNVGTVIQQMNINKTRLYKNFLVGMSVLALPYFFSALTLLFLPVYFLPAAIGLGLIFQIPYRFPRKSPIETTILEQMRNPYASPFRGIPITLSGQVIGRGSPGFIVGKDMAYQDSTGLIFLKYQSFFGKIGNFFFGLIKIKKIFRVPSRATGWFYRSIGSYMSLKYLQTDTKTVRSYPVLWFFLWSLALMVLSLYYYMFDQW